MHFIFWQNILSIHQSAFIRALAERHSVTLVTATEVSADRIAQGWHAPDFGKTKCMIAPTLEQATALIAQNPQAEHVFSGFFGVPLIQHAYQNVFARGQKGWFFLEPFETQGLKGILRHLKYRWFILKHRAHIKGILATGEKACRLYQACGMPEQHVFSWGYIT